MDVGLRVHISCELSQGITVHGVAFTTLAMSWHMTLGDLPLA